MQRVCCCGGREQLQGVMSVLYLENNDPKFHSKRCKGIFKPALDLWKNVDDTTGTPEGGSTRSSRFSPNKRDSNIITPEVFPQGLSHPDLPALLLAFLLSLSKSFLPHSCYPLCSQLPRFHFLTQLVPTWNTSLLTQEALSMHS